VWVRPLSAVSWHVPSFSLTLIPGVLFLLSVVGADRASSGVRGDGLVSRFYKTVSVIRSPTDAGWHVTLDGRTLRTPAKAQLLLPTHALALAVAAEWEWQDAKNIRPFTMPLMVRKLPERTFFIGLSNSAHS
jgi:ATP12 chaperone protein